MLATLITIYNNCIYTYSATVHREHVYIDRERIELSSCQSARTRPPPPPPPRLRAPSLLAIVLQAAARLLSQADREGLPGSFRKLPGNEEGEGGEARAAQAAAIIERLLAATSPTVLPVSDGASDGASDADCWELLYPEGGFNREGASVERAPSDPAALQCVLLLSGWISALVSRMPALDKLLTRGVAHHVLERVRSGTLEGFDTARALGLTLEPWT